MKLPTLNTKTLPVQQPVGDTAATTQASQGSAAGPVFISPVVDEATASDPLQEVPEDVAVEGMTNDVLAKGSAEAVQQTQTQPQSAPLSPRLAADDIAKLDELSRTLLEVRGIAVAAQSGARNEIAQVLGQIHGLGIAVEKIAASSQATEANYAALMKSVKELESETSSALLSFADGYSHTTARLDAIDTLLQSRGLPTSAAQAGTTKRPVLRLHAMRRLAKPAACANGVVTLFYNPRQGDGTGNAVDTQEFTLSAGNVRKVWTGYKIDVPDGYVCDVCIGSDVVSSLMGRGDVEFILAMTTRTTNRVVSGGSEIARLSLRKIEPLAMETLPWTPQ